ncbi:hypothetical protein HPB47_010806 [Ixodes persulcatus]|uniref:Uncharacterized protein n=1 Tax=Ixodes persulcatus TaxID=34615 RepID=A0AC60NY43_IXOPE|nr:hypothetical protein HPB47_010806 [Ixodes persulcatus]
MSVGRVCGALDETVAYVVLECAGLQSTRIQNNGPDPQSPLALAEVLGFTDAKEGPQTYEKGTVALACLWSPFYGSPYATDGSLLSLARHHLDAPVLMSSLLSTTEGSSTCNPSTMPLNKLPPRLSSPVSLPPSQEATASTPSSLEGRLCDKRLREICICFTGLGAKDWNDLPTDAVLHSNPAHFKAFIEEMS